MLADLLRGETCSAISCVEVCRLSIATIRQTPLYEVHRQLGARLIEFGGWQMPVDYPDGYDGRPGGLLREHLAVRSTVGLFDVSHMGDIRLHGPEALDAVQQMATNDAARLAVGQAQYSLLLNDSGTVVDDVVVHRLSADDFLLVINAGTRAKDLAWVRQAATPFRCTVEDCSDRYAQVAIQGPNAARLLQKLTTFDLTQLKSYWFARATVAGLSEVLIARTGYTGEDGFEIYLPSEESTAARVWHLLLTAGREFAVLPCGLGARNTLRLEAALPLYGHELSETITPLEARLERFLAFAKEFTGRAALQAQRTQGLRRQLVGLEAVDRQIPRDGYAVCDRSGAVVGTISSGSPSPTFAKNIALAFVPPTLAAPGSQLMVQVRQHSTECRVVPLPFYRRVRSPARQA